MIEMGIYKIIRFYKEGRSRAVKHGLSLEQAKLHCRDPSTKKVNKKGEIVWFEGFTLE
jgi:hypothetical protein